MRRKQQGKLFRSGFHCVFCTEVLLFYFFQDAVVKIGVLQHHPMDFKNLRVFFSQFFRRFCMQAEEFSQSLLAGVLIEVYFLLPILEDVFFRLGLAITGKTDSPESNSRRYAFSLKFYHKIPAFRWIVCILYLCAGTFCENVLFLPIYENRRFSAVGSSGGHGYDLDILAICDHRYYMGTEPPAAYKLQIRLSHRIPGFHPFAFLDHAYKAFSIESYRIDTYMDKHFQSVIPGDTIGMQRIGHIGNRSAQRGEDASFFRKKGYAFS